MSIELLQYLSHPQPVPEPRRACDVGCNHIALQVDDLDALHEKLVAEGIEFNVPPTVSSEGFAKVTYCRDPEGNVDTYSYHPENDPDGDGSRTTASVKGWSNLGNQ